MDKENKNDLTINDNEYQLEKIVEDDFFQFSPQSKINILEVQEKERQRIAGDLHDYSLQNLTHLIHKLELCSIYMDNDMIKAKLELAGVSHEIRNVIEDIRNTIFNLRPMSFDDLGVKEVFFRLKENLEANSSMNIVLDIFDIQSDNEVILMTIYRLVKECMTNAVKHSGGSKLYVRIEQIDNYIYIKIEDDGIGFDYEKIRKNNKGHFGLSMLYERILLLSGTMELDTGEMKGTRISMTIPL